VADVGDQLVSVGVDLDQVTGGTFWDPAGGSNVVPVAPYDFDRPQLRRLAAELAPAHLRIGGSASDRTYYAFGDSAPSVPPSPYVTQLTRTEWDAVSRFATDLGYDIILTINAGPGPRLPDGSWTDANAREILTYTAARGVPVSVLEFGNEPNLFGLRAGLSGYEASAYARDLSRMRTLRDEALPNARLAVPGNIFTRTQGEDLVPGVILGPTTADMLALVGPSIDIVTYHYYAAVSTRCPPAGPRVDADSALDAAYLDGIDEPIAAVTPLRDQYAPSSPIWMMESGGQSCGGQIGVADRFVNSFWYLNTLGRMARAGQQTFVRWTLSGSTYGLVDDATLEPRPDYWAAVLWRRLMGGVVLAPVESAVEPDLRLFAHCTRNGRAGEVTVLALNTSRTRTIQLDLGHRADLYLITMADPSAAEVLLNGTRLASADDGSLPDLAPVTGLGIVSLPPLSYAFAVVHDAAAPGCRIQSGN
jgi:hypothetical protein